MGILTARFRKDYDDGLEVCCPHCNRNQWRLNKDSVGLHECTDCNEAFKILESAPETEELKESLSDLESEIRWLKDRVEKLEHELGLD